MPQCGYQVDGIDRILLLDFDDFAGFEFAGSDLYSNCLVTAIRRSGDFVELACPDTAKYSSALQSGLYGHTLETSVGDISAETLAALHLATDRRYLAILHTVSDRHFAFAYDAGATVAYTNQTADGIGSLVTIAAASVYPLFEVTAAALTDETQNGEFTPDFTNGTYCETGPDTGANTGYKQATIAYKVSKPGGLPLDRGGLLVSVSGEKQAIALLTGYPNPDASKYEVERYFNASEAVSGNSSVARDAVGCPIGYITLSTDRIVLDHPAVSAPFTLESSHNWRLISGPPGLISLDYTAGSAGSYAITARGIDVGQDYFTFQNTVTAQTAQVYIINVAGRPWILTDLIWNMLGFWYDDGIWTS